MKRAIGLARRLLSVSKPRWFWGLFLLVFGGLAIAIELQFPSDLWTELDANGQTVTKRWAEVAAKVTAAATVVIAAISPVKGGLRAVGNDLELTRLGWRKKLEDGAVILFSDLVSSQGGPPWNQLTVRAYCVDRSGKTELLRCVAESRLHVRQTSGISWSKGKGCVGQAWQKNKVVTINLYRPDRYEALRTEASWNLASEELRQGLSWEEAETVQGQGYGAVAAYPVRADADLVGVVAVDSPPGTYQFLRSPTSKEAIDRYIYLFHPVLKDLWASYAH